MLGRFRLGFLDGRDQLQPRTITTICGTKRKNTTPSETTPHKKKRTNHPIIDMILHQGEMKYPIRALLDTGCSIALINQ